MGARGVAAAVTAGGGPLASVLVPSSRGAPGALGLRSGSNASPRRAADKFASLEGSGGGGADAGTDATAPGDRAGGYALAAGGYAAVAGGYCGEEYCEPGGGDDCAVGGVAAVAPGAPARRRCTSCSSC